MKKILLTGGSGFIGRNVIDYYKDSKDYQIFAPSSKELDCTNQNAVYECLKSNKFDYVFNFAVYGDGIDKSKDGTKMLEYNLRMYHNFAEHSDLYDKMIYLGSGAEYNKQYPICSVKEIDIGKTIPVDQYGLMKYTVNSLIEKSLNIYNFRLFGIFGKYEIWYRRFISNICCKSLFGLPLTIRQNVYFDYLFIEDFLQILDKFLKIQHPKFHSYNVVSGKRIDLLSLCNCLNEITGISNRIIVCNEGLGNEYTAANERINNECDINYTPIEVSMKKMLDYYKAIKEKLDITNLIY